MSSNEAKERVLQFQNAIWCFENLRKQLMTNASNSKAQIHSDFNQITEYLRGREATLLCQVDEIQRAKEETLQCQQAQLSQALGVIQTGLSLMLKGAVYEKHLDDIIQKLHCLELRPKENACITFRSGHSSLPESIVNYGSVDGNAESLVTSDPISTAAPSTKDYTLHQNSLFHDPLNEIQRNQMSKSGDNFVLPQLSNNIEDWLQKQNSSTKSEDKVPALNSFAVGQVKSALQCDLDLKCLSANFTADSILDLNRWLSKQTFNPNEQHSSDSSCYQAAATDRKLPERVEQKQADSVYQVSSDLKNWLQHESFFSSSSPSVLKSNSQEDSKMWLLETCQQLTSLDDLKHKNHFCHISQEPLSWLCSQAYKKQVASQKRCEDSFFSHIVKENDFWLKRKTETQTHDGGIEPNVSNAGESLCNSKTRCCRNTSAMEVDEKCLSSSNTSNTPLFQMKDICRANELCGSLSECVSKPDCCTLFFQERSQVKNPIDPSQAFKPLSLELHEWLLLDSQNSTKQLTNNTANNVFTSMPDVKTSNWLMNPSLNSTASKLLPSTFKDNKEELNLWLQKSSSTNLADCSSLMETGRSSLTSSDVTMSDWLMVETKDHEKHEEMHDQDKESEGWSICSDCHSTSTDQYAKDIAAADEYFKNWLY